MTQKTIKFPTDWVKRFCYRCDSVQQLPQWDSANGFTEVPCIGSFDCYHFLRDFRTHILDRIEAGDFRSELPTEEDPCQEYGLCGSFNDACTDSSMWGTDLCLYDKNGFEIIEE